VLPPPAALPSVIAQLLDPDRGPEPSGDFRVEPEAFVALLLAGFAVGILGHVFKVKTMVATGILMIFLATVGLPLYLQLTR
jgi:hypothetical protein